VNQFEDALANAVEGPISSYIIIASYLDEDGETMLYLNTPEDQPIHVSMGLVEFGKTYITRKFIKDSEMDI
jgi:hypothetical protein